MVLAAFLACYFSLLSPAMPAHLPRLALTVAYAVLGGATLAFIVSATCVSSLDAAFTISRQPVEA